MKQWKLAELKLSQAHQISRYDHRVQNSMNLLSRDIFNYTLFIIQNFRKNYRHIQQIGKINIPRLGIRYKIKGRNRIINNLINYNNKRMRQDMRERQRQIRKLHQSIQKYQQSPNTRKAVEQATIQLQNAIQYKFRKSQTNLNYCFPRTEDLSDDQYDPCPEIVDLKVQPDFISHDLSIAEQPESNAVYISEKTILSLEKHSPFSKLNNQARSKLKIKVVKKKNTQAFDTTSKLGRLRTEHIQANFSTISYKRDTISTKADQNESSSSKTKFAQPSSEVNRLRTKLKISSRIQHQSSHSPFSANLTMKTEYTHCTKRRQGKQNERIPLSCKQLVNSNSKHYISHNSTKKIESIPSKPYLNVRCSMKKKKEVENNTSILQQTQKKNKIVHKSFQNLKSIKLGHNSSEKIKVVKGLHA